MYAYVWNQQLDVWGITDCALSSSAGCSSSGVQYHHNAENDADDGTLTGELWSPLLGGSVFSLDESTFPADDCYGLSGTDRQPRLVKVGGVVQAVGCGYSRFLNDFIYPPETTSFGRGQR